MIKNIPLWNEFEKKLVSSTRPNFRQNLKIADALYAQYRKMYPEESNPLQGIETIIEVARVIRSV